MPTPNTSEPESFQIPGSTKERRRAKRLLAKLGITPATGNMPKQSKKPEQITARLLWAGGVIIVPLLIAIGWNVSGVVRRDLGITLIALGSIWGCIMLCLLPRMWLLSRESKRVIRTVAVLGAILNVTISALVIYGKGASGEPFIVRAEAAYINFAP